MIGVTTTIPHQEGEKEKYNHNYCLRCGRKLKNEEYKKIGYGAICLEKMKVQKGRKRLF